MFFLIPANRHLAFRSLILLELFYLSQSIQPTTIELLDLLWHTPVDRSTDKRVDCPTPDLSFDLWKRELCKSQRGHVMDSWSFLCSSLLQVPAWPWLAAASMLKPDQQPLLRCNGFFLRHNATVNLPVSASTQSANILALRSSPLAGMARWYLAVSDLAVSRLFLVLGFLQALGSDAGESELGFIVWNGIYVCLTWC
jgi:hypothetical protein